MEKLTGSKKLLVNKERLDMEQESLPVGEVILKEGEIVCDKCDGKGSLDVDSKTLKICPKCLGDKKVDWIENIMGKKSEVFTIGPSSFTTEYSSELYINEKPLDQHILDIMKEKISEEVEKQILKKFKSLFGGNIFDN